MEVSEMVGIDEAEYKEILAKLEDKHLAETVERSPEWEVVRRAAKQMHDLIQAQYNALDHTREDSRFKAMQCQIAIQFYENFLESLLSKYKSLGEEAYNHAKENGWLSGIYLYLKNNL